MQKITIPNSKGKNIVGVFYPGPLQTPIILTHGFGDTKEANGGFETIAKIINRSGFPVFTFDFTGSGESDEEIVCMETEIQDLKDVIKTVQIQGYKKFGLIGHSLGGWINIKTGIQKDIQDKIATYILWGTPTQVQFHKWKEWFGEEMINKLQTKGKLEIPTPKTNFMDSMIIDKRFIEESKEINPEILKEIDVPVLLLHGEEDRTVPLQQSVEAIQFLNDEAELVTLKEANHRCEKHLDEIGDIIVDWLNTYLKK